MPKMTTSEDDQLAQTSPSTSSDRLPPAPPMSDSDDPEDPGGPSKRPAPSPPPAEAQPLSRIALADSASPSSVAAGGTAATEGATEESPMAPSSTSAVISSTTPVPPDGGWGWMVVFGSFMIHVFADGITYTFGIFVVELMKTYNEGRGVVSLIPSILVGVTLGTGPIASALTNRYGCRLVTMLGALFAAAGFATTAWLANSIEVMYITIGIGAGLGFGMMYLPAIVSVSMYFEKRRAFATGIAVCGSGMGTFILAPITRALLDNLSLEMSFLSVAGLILLNILFGLLFRPLKAASSSSSSSSSVPASDDEGADDVGVGEDDDKWDDESRRGSSAVSEAEQGVGVGAGGTCLLQQLELYGNNPKGVVPPPVEIHLNGESIRPLAAQMALNGHAPGGHAHPSATSAHTSGKYSDMARVALSHPVLSSMPSQQQQQQQNGGSQHVSGSHSRIYEKRRRTSHHGHGHGHHRSKMHLLGVGCHHSTGVMFRKDILYGGSLYNIPEYKKSLSDPQGYSRHAVQDQQSCRRETRRASADSTKQFRICGCLPASAEAAKTFQEMMSMSLLKDPVFLLFAASNFFTSIGFNVPYVYTVDRAVLNDIDADKASFLLSIVGIANTVGRILLGYLSDKEWINRIYLYNTALAVCGATMALSNFCLTYTLQSVYCAVFGMTSGAYVGLTSVVLVDLLGLDQLTNAFGLLLLFQGIASVIGPPIIGLLYDATGDYDSGFYFAGGTIFLSGAMLFVLPYMMRRKAKMEEEERRMGHKRECGEERKLVEA